MLLPLHYFQCGKKPKNFSCIASFSPLYYNFSGKLRKARKKKVLTIESGRMNNSQTREVGLWKQAGGSLRDGLLFKLCLKMKEDVDMWKTQTNARWMSTGTCAATISTISLTLITQQTMHLTLANNKLQL